METGDIRRVNDEPLNKHWYIRNVNNSNNEPYELIENATLAKIICETKRWSTLKSWNLFCLVRF